MFALRCTRPLLRRLGSQLPPHGGLKPLPTNQLGDWYAKPLNIGRHRLILCMSEHTRLTVVLPAKDLPGLPRRLVASLVLLLRRLHVDSVWIAGEVAQMDTVQFAPTKSRSVLASMTQFGLDVQARFEFAEEPVIYLTDLDRALADSPCQPLGYGSPAAAVRALAGGAT